MKRLIKPTALAAAIAVGLTTPFLMMKINDRWKAQATKIDQALDSSWSEAQRRAIGAAFLEHRTWTKRPLAFSLWLLDEKGAVLWRHGRLSRFPRGISLPDTPSEIDLWEGPGGRIQYETRRISEDPIRYLVIGAPMASLWERSYLLYFIPMFLMTALAASAVILLHLRRQAAQAGSVLSRIREGQLEARLPVGHFGELGVFSAQFNRMADEIQSLVESLKRHEATRTQILEELAHDLRTPLTTILTLFEAISEGKGDADYYRECVAAALPEIGYVNRLIEDLFLLAQMNEPAYQPCFASLDLADLIQSEVRLFQASAVPGEGIEYRSDVSGLRGEVVADAHLMRRLLKNLLHNARRFANASVLVSARSMEGFQWELVVRDDGPGFDAGTLEAFGLERPSLPPGAASKDSLGLGLLIIRAIVKIHGGTLRAFNGTSGHDALGAVVQMSFSAALTETVPSSLRACA